MLTFCSSPPCHVCRSHIESLIHAAAAAQTQSELAQRVSTWRQRIDPILKAEEDRSAFDIHTYGTHILTRLVDITQEDEQAPAAAVTAAGSNGSGSSDVAADFVQVAVAADSFEVCRVFAAMLQLVNNRCAPMLLLHYSCWQGCWESGNNEFVWGGRVPLLAGLITHRCYVRNPSALVGSHGMRW